MSEQRHPLRLSEARERTPPVNPVEAMRQQLAVAVFGAVKEADVEQMVNKLKEQALAGDHKAMKMYFELIGVMGKQSPPAAENGAIKQLASAMQDLVDEIRVSRAPLPQRELKKLATTNGHAEED